jgi:hypothetical protein
VARVGQARKRDANEKPIVEALRRAGVLVQRISERGFCDLVCMTKIEGGFSLVLLEVKSRTGKATKAQVEYRRDGWPVVIVRTVDDALKACR